MNSALAYQPLAVRIIQGVYCAIVDRLTYRLSDQQIIRLPVPERLYDRVFTRVDDHCGYMTYQEIFVARVRQQYWLIAPGLADGWPSGDVMAELVILPVPVLGKLAMSALNTSVFYTYLGQVKGLSHSLLIAWRNDRVVLNSDASGLQRSLVMRIPHQLTAYRWLEQYPYTQPEAGGDCQTTYDLIDPIAAMITRAVQRQSGVSGC